MKLNSCALGSIDLSLYIMTAILPKYIGRTYAFRNSLEMPEIVNGHIVIRFNGAMARHQSLFGGGYGYVPSLINYGWRWKNQSVKPIHRFTYYEGDHFLEDAIHALFVFYKGACNHLKSMMGLRLRKLIVRKGR